MPSATENSGRSDNSVYKAFELLFERYGEQHWWPAESDWEVCVGAVLTQNTSWRNVELAIRKLRMADALCPGKILDMPDKEIEDAVRPSGFFRLKTVRLKAVAEWWLANADKLSHLSRRNGGDVLFWRQSLLGVNGVGQETADSILLYAFNLPVFVIDSYTARTASRHLSMPENCSYETLQQFFMRNLPTDVRLYNEYHALLVKNAKECCRKSGCSPDCPLRQLV